HPAKADAPGEPDQDGFMSFFEKKDSD
ncbi:MAG TPA: cell division protein ZapA, partial [Ruminococcaceae bacterium]|nr:cell division protein ZapA [Oscillospiraceae bacterium]